MIRGNLPVDQRLHDASQIGLSVLRDLQRTGKKQIVPVADILIQRQAEAVLRVDRRHIHDLLRKLLHT